VAEKTRKRLRGPSGDIISFVNLKQAIALFAASMLGVSETITLHHQEHIHSEMDTESKATTASPGAFGGAQTALDEESYSLMPWAPPQVRNSFLATRIGRDWQIRMLYEFGGLSPGAQSQKSTS
jgi:hypothetical protein